MKTLYLARHGEAISSATDHNQPLSDRGIDQTEKLAYILKEFDLKIDIIFHSKKLRAKQTAEIYAQAIRSNPPVFEKEGLSPMDPITSILNEIKYEEKDLMLVGHLPFMEILLTTLLFQEERISPFDFSPSAVVCLTEELGNWKIKWALSSNF